MYAPSYHHYEPSTSTNIVDTYRKFGWTPPSEREDYKIKWRYFKEQRYNTGAPAPRAM